jgi:hypothetical protein
MLKEQTLMPVIQIYDSVVFWTWVKCTISFLLGFTLGLLF